MPNDSGDYSRPVALLSTVVKDTTKLKTIIPNNIKDATVVAIMNLPPYSCIIYSYSISNYFAAGRGEAYSKPLAFTFIVPSPAIAMSKFAVYTPGTTLNSSYSS